MRRDNLSGSIAGRKRSSKGVDAKEDGSKKPKFTTNISSWLSPVARTKVARSTITPAPKAALGVKKEVSHSLTQSYIDLGQQSFGKHVSCTKCGLLYTAGEEEDEMEHEMFCKRMTRGVAFAKWKTERVLKRFPDTCSRIVEIKSDDPSSHVKKLREIKKVLDDALGFVDQETFLQRRHFVYIQDHQVVGCVNMERITEAVTLDKRAFKLKSSSLPYDGAVTASTDVKSAVVGICQLWVHPLFRRKSIASRMMDVVREKSVYGMHVAKDLVAFAQPTRNGLQFAQKYMEPCEVLIY